MDLLSNLAISTVLFLFGIGGIFLNRKNMSLKQHSISPYFDPVTNKK